MRIRDWLRPPRSVLTVFVAIALVCVAALCWLAWLLLEHDKAVEAQQRQERVEQAADRAVAIMQRALATLTDHLRPGAASSQLPVGVAVIENGPTALKVHPRGALLYYPAPSPTQAPPADALLAGEQAEFARQNLDDAIAIYAGLSESQDEATRVGALTRLARAYRKAGKRDLALRAYERLSSIDGVQVDELPASLIAREARASILKETGRLPELRAEAESLRRDLLHGRWRLTAPQFHFYLREAQTWLGAAVQPEANALARSEAVEWLAAQPAHESSAVRLHRTSAGPVLLLARATGSQQLAAAVIADASYLSRLCAEAVSDLKSACALTDLQGNPIGNAISVATTKPMAVRTAAATTLPWTVHVFPSEPLEQTGDPGRRRLLVWLFALLGILLITGTYFTLRSISRELRVARLQSDFVNAVSHEFRSPLTSLSQISDLLVRDRLPSEDAKRKSYDLLARECDRLKQLVEGLLDFGRIEAGAATYRFEPIEIGAFVRDLVTQFQERVAADGIALEHSGLPQPLHVRADREALGRALLNLLDNAVKYSPECRTVWVDVERRDHRVHIAVRDQGIGIPLAEQQEVFDKFVRGAGPKQSRIRGTGIGLAMVRQIIDAHGGEVRLKSKPGQGSVFTLVLHEGGISS